jgi:hypothetical protein
MVGCSIGSRREVPGERKPVIIGDDENNNIVIIVIKTIIINVSYFATYENTNLKEVLLEICQWL